jgi:hypothetical protein
LIQQSQRSTRDYKASELKWRFQISCNPQPIITSIKPTAVRHSAHPSHLQSIQGRLSPKVISNWPRIANDGSTTLDNHRLAGQSPINLGKSGVIWSHFWQNDSTHPC